MGGKGDLQSSLQIPQMLGKLGGVSEGWGRGIDVCAARSPPPYTPYHTVNSVGHLVGEPGGMMAVATTKAVRAGGHVHIHGGTELLEE